MPTTDKQQAAAAALAHRAQRMSMLRHRAAAGVIATFVLALGTVGFTGSMGESDSAASGSSAALVDDSSSSSATTSSSGDATWGDDDGAASDGGVAPMSSGQS